MKGVFVLAYQPFEVDGLGWVDEDFNRSINQFNVLGLPEYDTGPEPFIGHIFMSRPSLSISRNMEVIQNLAQLHGIITDTYGLQLAKMLDAYARNKWLPIVTARAKNFNVNDMELRTVEKGGTFYGHTMTYSKHNEEHKFNGTCSIDFRNDKYYSIFKMMYIWTFYIHQVSKHHAIEVDPYYEEKGILDYCGSLYYVVTKADNHRVIYWEKLVGVRPKKIPLSIFNWEDQIKVVDSVSIDFEYGQRADPMDPAILMDINMLGNHSLSEASSLMSENIYRIITDEDTGRRYPALKGRYSDYRLRSVPTDQVPWAKCPFIMAKRNTSDGTIEYYLEWQL